MHFALNYTQLAWKCLLVKIGHRRNVISGLGCFRNSAVWVGVRLYPGWLHRTKIEAGGCQLQESRFQFCMWKIWPLVGQSGFEKLCFWNTRLPFFFFFFNYLLLGFPLLGVFFTKRILPEKIKSLYWMNLIWQFLRTKKNQTLVMLITI